MITTIKDWKIFESNTDFNNEDILKYVDYPGFTFKKNKLNNFNLYLNDINIGFFRADSFVTINGSEYLVIDTVYLDEDQQRKGIYKAIIKGLAKYGKKESVGKFRPLYNGVASYPFDISSDTERTQEATAFWEKMYNERNAFKRLDRDGGYIYWTTKKFAY